MLLTISQAVDFLKKGKIVVFPTETVYGLGAAAANSKAVEKIYQAKKRPRDNPLICHFYNFEQVKKFIKNFPVYLPDLVNTFSPGPVSYLVPMSANSPLSPAVLDRPNLTFRIPKHPIALELLQKLNQPIAAPSANLSGKFSGTNLEMIQKDLGNRVDGFLKSDSSEFGLESTILDCRHNNFIKILRPGALDETSLANFCQTKNIQLIFFENQNLESKKPLTPGQKYRHYAPKTRLKLVSKLELENILVKTKTTAVLSNQENLVKNSEVKFLFLGQKPSQVAKNLFFNFYLLDQQNIDLGLIYLDFSNQKLDSQEQTFLKAIWNRLTKAVE